VPLGGLPGATSPTGERRKVTRILSPAHRHYEFAATIGPLQRAMHSCRPVLDTGAGIHLVRPIVLPANWQSYAEKLERTPRIQDANNSRLIANYAIHLYIDVGCAKVIDRFFVAEHISVPCILGTEFMDNYVEAIFTLLKKVLWRDHVGDVSRNLRQTPILATLLANKWERSWEDKPAKVRACRQVRVKGRMEECVMAASATPDLVTISYSIRLCRHKSVAVPRGVALVKPDEPFLVKVCNFGPDQAIARKNSIRRFSEPFQGPMSAAITEEKATKDTPTGEDTSTSDDPVEDVDISEVPEHLHKQIREMLRTHSAMWDGTLGSIHATEHAIVTPTDAVSMRAQPYCTGRFQRQIIADQINKMLKLKVIESSHSAWASPVVIVPNKNGKARFCVYYRRLNNITKKDAYPLPRMEDCLDSLGDAQIFNSLDCTAGYWQVPLRSADREKTAFTTHTGIYHWLFMPFRLTNPPATFQRALDIILSDVQWQLCLVYLDDVIIFCACAQQHVKDVDVVLTR